MMARGVRPGTPSPKKGQPNLLKRKPALAGSPTVRMLSALLDDHPETIASVMKRVGIDPKSWSNTKAGRIRSALIPSPSVAEAAEPVACGLPNPSYSDCPNMKEVGGGFEGERYRCAVCGEGYFLDYEDMK